MNEPTELHTEQAELSLNENIHAIYSSGNETAINLANKLLINALCRDDGDSRSALRQFFGLPTPGRAAGPGIDRVLISQARLFINGSNANRVQAWLSSYETSPAHSLQRSALEKTLRTFVATSSQIQEIRSTIEDSRTLVTELSSKRNELRLLQENMHNEVRRLRQWRASKQHLP